MPNEEQLRYWFNQIGYDPSEEQWAVHLDQHRIREVAGGERALALDTVIPTLAGWQTIGAIEEGEQVFDDMGTPCSVVHKTEVFENRPCYEITFDTGEKVIADAGHLWAVQRENERKNTNRMKIGGRELFVAPSALITERKHTIRTTEGLTFKTFLAKPKTRWGIRASANYSIACCLPTVYSPKTLPIHPYLLGAWLGDGTSSAGSITSDISDDEIRLKVESIGYLTHFTPSNPDAWVVEGLATQLRLLGVKNNKHIPKIYLQSSVEQRLELLKGLLDTDGGASYKGAEFYNNNETLIDNVQELLASLGIKSWKREKIAKLYGKPCGIAYTLTFSSLMPLFSLTRKRDKQNLYPAGHTRNHYIRSVEPITSVPVQCLTVDSPSNLFLITKSFIPTHNSGKSYSSANDLFARLPEGKLYWLVAADYERTRAEFNYIIEAHEKAKIKYRATKSIDPGEIENEMGIRIATKSAKDPRKLAMEAPDGILGCEASQLDYETLLRMRGRVAEKRGWMLLSGTFEGSLGWYVDLFELGKTENDLDLKSFSLPTWSNKAIYPGGRTDPEILALENLGTKEWFDERFGGTPTPPQGLVHRDFRMNIHVGTEQVFRFQPFLPVYIWVDPGYASAYSVLAAQKIDDETAVVFDEIYERGLVTDDIITICQKKSWWGNVKGGAIDIAAKQHQAMTAPVEVWMKKGGVVLRNKKIRIQDGIERVNTSLKVNPITNKPGLYINARVKGLISELGGCPNPITNQSAVYKWRTDSQGNVIGEVPDDKNNHSAKALAYGLIDMFGYTTKHRGKKIKTFNPWKRK